MISVLHKWAYIHITKTAGTSIEHRLKENYTDITGPQHAGYKKLDSLVNLDEYFTFAFVRNPWDRIVSLYHHHKYNVPNLKHFFESEDISFEDYVLGTKTYGLAKSREGTINPCQLSWLEDSKGELGGLDFIGRFESLQQDWSEVCRLLKLHAMPLEHLNKTGHSHYHEYYSDETREIIANQYADDIRYFGYRY